MSSYLLGRRGKGYIGTDEIKTSEPNQNIVPISLVIYKLSFLNHNDCTIKINNGDPIYLEAKQGFDSGIHDAEINSFEIIEDNVKY